MPLFDAVYWIASTGHSKNPTNHDWDNAAHTMIDALFGEHLAAIGMRTDRKASEVIPALDWRGVVTSRLNDEPCLSLIGPVGEDQPQNSDEF